MSPEGRAPAPRPERILSAISGQSRELIAALDPGHRILFANAAWENAFGRVGEAGMPQVLLEQLLPAFARAEETGVAQEIVVRWQGASGLIRYMQAACARIAADDEQCFVLVTAQDITETREAESKERLLAHAVSCTRDCFCLTDLSDTILFVNPSFCATYGYSEEELIGQSIRMVRRPSEAPGELDQVREKTIVGEWNGEVINRRKDGSEFPVELWTSVVRDSSGEPVALAGIARDITERRRTDAFLRESENRFRSLVENSADGIALLDQDFRPIYHSPAIHRILGYEIDELLGIDPLDLIHPDDREAVAKLLQEQLRQPGVPVTGQYRARHKGGGWRWLESTSTNLLHDPGIGAIVVNYRDITERLHAEKVQAAVYEIAEAADRSRTLGELYEAVHAIVSTIMPANNFYIALYDETEDILSFPYFRDEVDEPSPSKKPGKGLTEYVLRTGKPLLCTREVMADLERRGEAELVGMPSPIWLGVPLVTGGKSIGVMVVQHYEDPNAYGEQEQRMLEFVSSQVAKAIGRKRVEERLRKSEERYRNFVERSGEAIWRLELKSPIPVLLPVEDQLVLLYSHGILAECNDAMAQMYSLANAASMAGKQLGTIFPEGDPAAREFLRRFIASGYRIAEEELMRSAGQLQPQYALHTLIGTVSDGFLVQVWGTQRDISEAKRSQELLRQSEEKFRLLFEESQDAILMTTPDGQVVDINEAGLELLGYASKAEVCRANIARDIYVNPEEREIFKQILARHGYVIDFEFTVKRRDGQQRIVLESASAERDESGTIVSYRAFVRDITERKMLEDQLRQAQKMEGIGTLAGGIAHDFNNLLGIILGYATLLESPGIEPAKFRQSIDVIKKAVDRGANLVRQLLTFARKADPSFRSVHLHETIIELVKMLRQTFPKTITITTELDEHLPSVIADSTQLHQALLNLCVNARDAMSEEYGGTGVGTLTLQTGVVPGSALRQAHATAGADEYILIKVSDTGVGMDEATRGRIFEPFFTTKGLGKGTGLGLAVVYGVVNSHHGFVNVESEVGKGTSFILYLPVQSRKLITPKEPPRAEKAASEGKKKILVVEDEELLCELLKNFLQEQGFDVLTAHDGQEALDCYESRRAEIDLVLSDMGLPRLGGWEMFQKMRELNPEVRAILASGYFDPNLKMDLLKAGAMDFVQKPYNTDYILQRIHEILSTAPAPQS